MMASFKPAGLEDSDDSFDDFLLDDENDDLIENVNGNSHRNENVQADTESCNVIDTITQDDFRLAILQGNTKAVRDLIDKGVDANAVFSSSWTALMYAGNVSRKEVFRLLLSEGASPSYCDKDLVTVLMITSGSCSSNSGDVSECVRMLLERDIDVNAKDRYHITSLMYAGREGRTDVAEMLLEKGALVDSQDHRGWTALSWATNRKKCGTVEMLLRHGAEKAAKHSDCSTAVQLAQGNQEILRLFGELSVGSSDQQQTASAGLSGAGGDGASGLSPDPGSTFDTSDLTYGDLEVFLFGLGLGHIHSQLGNHKVDFPLLLTLSEEDFINIGIKEVGVRKKLLEGIAAVHKRSWETSSLVPIHIRSQVRCPDAVAIVANVSKHLRYICSSIKYIKWHLRRDSSFLSTTRNGMGPKQLMLHAGDAVKNNACLQLELTALYSLLSAEVASSDFSPPDLILPEKDEPRGHGLLPHTLGVLGLGSACVFFWKRHLILQLWSLLQRVQCLFIS